MRGSLTESTIVGGMRAAKGNAAFARARVVLVLGGATPAAPLLLAKRFPSKEVVEGDALSEAEWRGLLASGEALELQRPDVPAVPQAALWIARENFSFREEARRELEERGALHHLERHGNAWLFVVEEDKAAPLREEWSVRAFNRAWDHAVRGDLDAALEDAKLAVELAKGLVDERLALECLLYEHKGDKARSEGYLEMARNSGGEELYRRICEKKIRFAKELDIAPSSVIRPSPNAYRGQQSCAIKAAFAAMLKPRKAA